MIEYNEFHIFAGKIITSLPRFFLQKNPYSKLIFGQNFIVNRFSNFLGQTKRQILQRNIFSAVKLNGKYLRNTVIRD